MATSITKVICGEYSSYYLCNNNTVYTPLWNQSTTSTQSLPIPGLPATIVDGSGGLHNAIFIDSSGNVWTYGDNSYGEQGSGVTGGSGAPYQILKDSTGNPFTGITKVLGYVFTNFAIKSDGTVWYWGQDVLNIFGGNVLSPKQLPFPPTTSIQKIVGQLPFLFLDTMGGVWEWGVNSKSPTKISLPYTATDIAGTITGLSVAVIGGFPYAWGAPNQQAPWGVTGVPTSMQIQWKVTGPIKQIVGNDNTLHYIDGNGDLWGLGDDAMGEVGDGQEVNFSVVTPPNALYAWSWARYQLMKTLPIHIVPGTKFTQICTQTSDVFYVFAQDTAGNWWSWGRNKANVLGNDVSLQGNLASTYPNLVDQPRPEIVTPLTMQAGFSMTYAQGQAIYAANTGFPIPTTTTTTTTTSSTTSTTTTLPTTSTTTSTTTSSTSTTSTSTSTSTTTSTSTSTTTSTTTTSTTTHWPFITLFNDGVWSFV